MCFILFERWIKCWTLRERFSICPMMSKNVTRGTTTPSTVTPEGIKKCKIVKFFVYIPIKKKLLLNFE